MIPLYDLDLDRRARETRRLSDARAIADADAMDFNRTAATAFAPPEGVRTRSALIRQAAQAEFGGWAPWLQAIRESAGGSQRFGQTTNASKEILGPSIADDPSLTRQAGPWSLGTPENPWSVGIPDPSDKDEPKPARTRTRNALGGLKSIL